MPIHEVARPAKKLEFGDRIRRHARQRYRTAEPGVGAEHLLQTGHDGRSAGDEEHERFRRARTGTVIETSALNAKRISFDDQWALQEHFHAQGWTDGLPVVPPTAEAVAACLEWALLRSGPPDRRRAGPATDHHRREGRDQCSHGRVPADALPGRGDGGDGDAAAEPFLLHGATASTGGCGVLVIVNGPIRHEIGMDATFNAVGPSDRAGTCIGRAVRLVLSNLLDVRPGEIDRSTLGHPGKISFCIAEDEEHTPWPSLAAERIGDPDASAVTVMAAMAPRQIMNEWTTDPSEILDTFVAEMRANMRHYSIWAGNYAIVVPPQLRDHFDRAGWSKADIRDYVFEHARIRRREWADVGKAPSLPTRVTASTRR